jgi:hypothetical protein
MLAPASLGQPQQECSSGKPLRLIKTINPVVGQSPVWVTTGAATGTKPILWEGSNNPVQVLWIRDLAVKGPALLSGTLAGGKAKATFAKAALGLPTDRFKFDALGDKPESVKDDDLRRYAFHRTYVWFPEPGCYEFTARVGSQQSVIRLAAAKK